MTCPTNREFIIQYPPGTTVYVLSKSLVGRLEKVCIKRFAVGLDRRVRYVDSFNAFWLEEELCDYATALSNVQAYYSGVVADINAFKETELFLTTTLSASYGSSVTYIATVYRKYRHDLLVTGTVRFYCDSVLMDSVELEDGRASLSISSLGAGSHLINAVYSGDHNFGSSSSDALTRYIDKASVGISVMTMSGSIYPWESVTFISNFDSVGPTGVVDFYLDGTLIGSGDIMEGSASIDASDLTVGTYILTARYSGDDNYFSVLSNVESLEVLAEFTPVFNETFYLENASPDLTGMKSMFGWVRPVHGSNSFEKILFGVGRSFLLTDRDLEFWDIGLSIGALVEDEWNFVGITYDGSVLRLYLNNSVGMVETEEDLTLENFRVGVGNDEKFIRSDLFRGDIESIGVWDVVLTSDQISALKGSRFEFNDLPEELKYNIFIRDFQVTYDTVDELVDQSGNEIVTNGGFNLMVGSRTLRILSTSSGDILEFKNRTPILQSYWNLGGSVIDSAGGNNLISKDVLAKFTYSVNEREVTFTDTSNLASSWLWEFGDGNTSSVQNPIHTYGVDGIYTVRLTVDSAVSTSHSVDAHTLVESFSEPMNGEDLQGSLISNASYNRIALNITESQAGISSVAPTFTVTVHGRVPTSGTYYLYDYIGDNVGIYTNYNETPITNGHWVLTGNLVDGNLAGTYVTHNACVFSSGGYLQFPESSTSSILQWVENDTFTVELWVKLTGNVNQIFFADGDLYWFLGTDPDGKLEFYNNTNTGAQTWITDHVMPLNAWTHVSAIARDGTLRLYLNGNLISENTGLLPTATNSAVYKIGHPYGYVTGMICDFRVVYGVAVYEGNRFAVPTVPLTAISGTTLLTCQGSITDQSTNHWSITNVGVTITENLDGYGDTPTVTIDPRFLEINGGGYLSWLNDGNSMTIDVVNGIIGQNAIHELSLTQTPTSGIAAVSMPGSGGGSFSYADFTTPTIQSFMNSLIGAGNATVNLVSALTWDIEYINGYGSRHVNLLLGDGSGLRSNSGYVRLTTASNGLYGAVDYVVSDLIGDATNFAVEFDFYANGLADSVYFYLYTSIVPPTEDYPVNGYQVYFDEYVGHPSGIGVVFNGITLNSFYRGDLGNATWRTARIYYSNQYFKVYVNGTLQLECNDSENSRDLTNTHIGLGGRTGGENAEHRIRNFRILS